MNGEQDRLPALLGGVYGATDIASRGVAARKEIPALLQESSKAKEEAEISKFQAEQGVQRRVADVEKGIAEKSRVAASELEAGIKPYQEFVQPEYKASDYAANAAARLFTGLMLGGIAKTSAIGQLKAVRDMQKAEDQGLREEFAAAKIRFDEGEKARKDFNDNLRQRVDRMMKLLSTDRNAALAEAKIIESSLGEGAIRASFRAGNLQKGADQLIKIADKADNLQIAKEQTKAKTEAAIGVALAKAAAKGAPEKKQRESVKLDSDQRKEFRRIGEAKQFYDRVSSTYQDKFFGLAKIPGLAQLQLNLAERGIPIPDKAIEAFGGKAGLTPEVINWWKNYYEYVAKIRNTLFGATLTANEKAEFDKFTITPATTPENAKEFFKRQQQIIRDKAEGEINRSRALQIPDSVSSVFMGFNAKDFPRKFSTEADAKAAFDKGLLKSGDFVIVGNSTTPQEVE